MTCRESTDLGAYVLGALGPAERSAMARHVRGCPHCTAELLALAPLPGLLRHTPLEDVTGDGVTTAGGAAAGDPPVPGRRTRWTRRTPGTQGVRPRGPWRSWVLVPAAAALLCVVGLVLAAVIGLIGLTDQGGAHGTSRPPAAITLSHTDPSTRVSASADLTPEAWGTAIRLTLAHLPPGVVCRLVVHARNAPSETAGTWSSGYGDGGGGSSSVPASTSVSPKDITALDVVTGTGRVLVTVR